MCNAWNHSPDCRCGWGGMGYLGRGGNFTTDRWVGVTFKTYRELLIGATHPNAHCPVCGAKVFFYESPYGGRVFFDDLGPPWPKHPCTSSNQQVSLVRRIAIDFHSRVHVSPPPFRDGWMPFLCEIVESIASDRTIQRLEGWLEGERKTFYVRDGLFQKVRRFSSGKRTASGSFLPWRTTPHLSSPKQFARLFSNRKSMISRHL